MKYLFLLCASMTLWSIYLSKVFADEPITNVGQILIAEVQTGSVNSAGDEFVELYNNERFPLRVEGVKLQYKSKTGENWTTKAELSGTMAPHGRYLLSAYSSDNSSQDISSGMAASAGHVRIINQTDEILDVLGWGDDADSPEQDPISIHEKGQSLKRLFSEDGEIVDSNNNVLDFFVSESPSPAFTELITIDDEEKESDQDDAGEKPEETGTTDSEPKLQDSAGSANDEVSVAVVTASNAKLQITEVMPDPVSPLTDKEHEFIELFNPNGFAVQLNGYELESGTDWRYKYTLGEYLLKPHEYLAIFASDSGLTLSNSGTGVRLSGGAGVVSEMEYPKAKPGSSYSYVGSEWVWSNPSPNSVNLAFTNQNETEPSVSGSTKKVAVSNPLTKQNVAFESDLTDSSKSKDEQKAPFKEFEPETTINTWVLAGVGVLAVLYGCYEYRNDINIRMQQLRRYYRFRREDRTSS